MKLIVKNISKAYRKTKAIIDFSAEFNCGIYALLGPNGSGKSTLMNIIACNLKADSGQILYQETPCWSTNTIPTDLDAQKPSDIQKIRGCFRKKLGFMPQNPGMYPNFTVERFLWYIGALKGMNKAATKTQIEGILNAIELTDIRHRKIKTLSGGMKQRLALAQAIIGKPEILILDEPTAGLDPKQRVAVRNYISKIAFNKIVIIATHVVSDIEYIAENIIILKKGIITDKAPPHELVKKIEGKVWNIKCSETQVADYQQKFRVTNIAKTDDDNSGVLLRVLAEEKPTDQSYSVTPNLEDYYLYVFTDEVII